MVLYITLINMISIILPAYNEEAILKENTLKVFDFCKENIKDNWSIVISDNGSTDDTPNIARQLAGGFQQIKYLRTQNQGKGYAVIEAWQNYPSDIYVFMDADLSTNLKSLPELIERIKNGCDVALGSRFAHNSQVSRSLKRKIFSLGLRVILKILFKLKVKDAPCGFKAVNQAVVDSILPRIQNKTWFFDTEMLILSQRAGFKINEIPVIWQEMYRPSRINSFDVIKDYLKNIYRLYAAK